MFEDATFDSRSMQRSQAPRWMLLTLIINLGVVAAMIVLPLMYPASLPSQLLERALYVPVPSTAPAQEPPSPTAAVAPPCASHHADCGTWRAAYGGTVAGRLR